MRRDVREADLNLGNAVRIDGRLRLREQEGTLPVRRQHPVEQAVLSARCLLRYMPDAGVAWRRDSAIVRGELASDQLEKRRLAGAVAADQSDLVPGRNSSRGNVEDRPALDAVGELVDMQHGEPK